MLQIKIGGRYNNINFCISPRCKNYSKKMTNPCHLFFCAHLSRSKINLTFSIEFFLFFQKDSIPNQEKYSILLIKSLYWLTPDKNQ